MLTFLRKIRHHLINQGSTDKLMQEGNASKPASPTGRYLLYALGEIALVVIGILIALQINDWKQQKTDRAEEKSILANLQLEFSKNKDDLMSFKDQYHSAGASCKKLIELTGEPTSKLQQFNIDSLLSEAINYWDYRPSDNVLSDLISSGRLNLLTSDKLRNLLFEWSSAMKEKEEAFSTMDIVGQEQLIPYLTTNASIKNIDSYGFMAWKTPSKLKDHTLEMFQKIEFENHLSNHAWGIYNYLIALDKIETLIDQILQETSI